MNEKAKLELLQSTFDRLFFDTFNTRLVYGAREPFYQAPTATECAKILSREDFLSSALHETAHWTIAGAERRQLDDFGYWYEPDGRSNEQQAIFEQVEVKPQAIEWAFSIACKHRFNLSADNLGNAAQPSVSFKNAVTQQVVEYWQNGLPKRAQLLFDNLLDIFHSGARPQLTDQLLEQC